MVRDFSGLLFCIREAVLLEACKGGHQVLVAGYKKILKNRQAAFRIYVFIMQRNVAVVKIFDGGHCLTLLQPAQYYTSFRKSRTFAERGVSFYFDFIYCKFLLF